MPGLLQRFLPREEGFFDLFDKQADNIHVGAKALLEMLSHYTGVPEQVQGIKAIEHHGDDNATAEVAKCVHALNTPDKALKYCIKSIAAKTRATASAGP